MFATFCAVEMRWTVAASTTADVSAAMSAGPLSVQPVHTEGVVRETERLRPDHALLADHRDHVRRRPERSDAAGLPVDRGGRSREPDVSEIGQRAGSRTLHDPFD